jgi:uncharacterized tellurite resistance protein B-like protein
MTAICYLDDFWSPTKEDAVNEAPEFAEFMRRVHWHRNVEKHNVMLEGMLMVVASKGTVNAAEMAVLNEMFDISAGFEGKEPWAVRELRKTINTNAVNSLPELAREILGNGGLDMGWNVAAPEDRRTTLLHGIRLMIEADGIVEESEDKIIQAFADEGLSLLESAVVNGEPVVEDGAFVYLEGKTFVLTGQFSESKKSLHARIEAAGGQTHANVVKRADYLVVADKGSHNWSTSAGGDKVKKALEYGLCIISEQDLLLALH